MKSNILWTTSFNKELYTASGQYLLKSFIDTETEGKMLIAYETNHNELFGFEYALNDNDKIAKEIVNKFIPIDIIENEMLKKFLEDNNDIIPVSLGGELHPCNCPDPWAQKDRYHKRYCNHVWFKRNMSRWFRKFVTLNEARKLMKNYDYLIWIDCDCIFKKQMTYEIIKEIVFDNDLADIAYLRGNRQVLEAGFIGYNLNKDGENILINIILKYTTGEFRNYRRWDDSYIIQKIISKMSINRNDLGTYIVGEHSDIFTRSKIGEFIQHNKGTHGRKLHIMK